MKQTLRPKGATLVRIAAVILAAVVLSGCTNSGSDSVVTVGSQEISPAATAASTPPVEIPEIASTPSSLPASTATPIPTGAPVATEPPPVATPSPAPEATPEPTPTAVATPIPTPEIDYQKPCERRAAEKYNAASQAAFEASQQFYSFGYFAWKYGWDWAWNSATTDQARGWSQAVLDNIEEADGSTGIPVMEMAERSGLKYSSDADWPPERSLDGYAVHDGLREIVRDSQAAAAFDGRQDRHHSGNMGVAAEFLGAMANWLRSGC